jgi:hypothetical protein
MNQREFATKHCHQVAGLLSGDLLSAAESMVELRGIEPLTS